MRCARGLDKLLGEAFKDPEVRAWRRCGYSPDEFTTQSMMVGDTEVCKTISVG